MRKKRINVGNRAPDIASARRRSGCPSASHQRRAAVADNPPGPRTSSASSRAPPSKGTALSKSFGIRKSFPIAIGRVLRLGEEDELGRPARDMALMTKQEEAVASAAPPAPKTMSPPLVRPEGARRDDGAKASNAAANSLSAPARFQ